MIRNRSIEKNNLVPSVKIDGQIEPVAGADGVGLIEPVRRRKSFDSVMKTMKLAVLEKGPIKVKKKVKVVPRAESAVKKVASSSVVKGVESEK